MGNAYHWESLLTKAQARGYHYEKRYDPVLVRGERVVFKSHYRVIWQRPFLEALFGAEFRAVAHLMADLLMDQEEQVLAFLDSLEAVPLAYDERRGVGPDMEDQEREAATPIPGA